MNKNDFLSLIGTKVPIDRQVLAEINELVSIFPYFQTAHLLLLKGLQDNSDIRFDNQLRNSSIHIADRELLYNLLKIAPESVEPEPGVPVEIHDASIQEQEVPVEIHDASIQEPEVSVEIHHAAIHEPEEPVDVHEFVKRESLPEEQGADADPGDMEQTVIESAKNSEDLIVEIERSYGEMDETGQEEKADQMINRPILVSLEQENNESEGRGIMIIEDEPHDPNENIFYMDPGFSVPVQDESPEEESFAGSEDLPEPEPADVTEPLSEDGSKNLSRQAQSDLIDKFISESPRIEPKRETGDHLVEDLAERFTEVKGGFVTETLARIYVNQGYYSKAIDVYEKLSLKFPEKSGYFATQIEKIKAIIK
jgi:hypothetical protein